jgi:2-oxoisovalerate ferredoxin oxidoreductase beta subunit
MAKDIEKPIGFYKEFDRKPGCDKETTHYCPGCGHGRVHKLVAEALVDLGVLDKTIFVSPVGCSVFGYYYFDTGNIQAAHGRAPAVATGAAHANPEGMVISYQGDGDLAAIGTAEIIHAANRGENMTVIFVNNAIYGMTGGQMAPTTIANQKTTTTPNGRDTAEVGAPMKMCEIISTLEAPVYVERVAVSDAKHIMKAKRAINKALRIQKEKKGFTFVEVLSACPSGWKMSPLESIDWITEALEKNFPLGVYKDVEAERVERNHADFKVEPNKVRALLGMDDESKIFATDKNFIENFKDQNIKIAGFGGQGVLMGGSTIAYLAMEMGLEVTWLPSYGPEMRGGTANCSVNISKNEIGTPVVEYPNILVAMNTPSLHAFIDTVTPGGLVIVNSSVINEKVTRPDVKAIYVPMNEIAESVDLRAATNMAAVAAYMSYAGVFEIDNLKTFMKHKFKKPDLLDKNFKIIDKTVEHLKANY